MRTNCINTYKLTRILSTHSGCHLRRDTGKHLVEYIVLLCEKASNFCMKFFVSFSDADICVLYFLTSVKSTLKKLEPLGNLKQQLRKAASLSERACEQRIAPSLKCCHAKSNSNNTANMFINKLFSFFTLLSSSYRIALDCNHMLGNVRRLVK